MGPVRRKNDLTAKSVAENFSQDCVKSKSLYTVSMKTLILFIFFASLFFYLKPSGNPTVVSLDEIQVKLAAPERENKVLSHRHINRAPTPVEGRENLSQVAQSIIETNTSIEQGWESQLRVRLLELDPVAGNEIFTKYQKEKDSYALKIESLVKDHQESSDLEHLIDELDLAHQQRLQDIFGPYFEDLRDLQSAVQQ